MANWSGIIISPGCSLKCVFCGGHRKPPKNILEEEEIRAYLNLKFFKKRGDKKIAISGSDPIEYEKIVELISYIKKSGFKRVHLSTHGTLLASPEFAKKIIKAGLDEIKIPIYGPNSKIHESVTQTPKTFEKAILAIFNLRKFSKKIRIQTQVLILKQNQDELLNILKFLFKLPINQIFFSIPCLEEEEISFYLPIKSLPPILKELYFASLKSPKPVSFLEIPFCAFGKIDLKRITNTCAPPDLGKYNLPPLPVRTAILSLPAYRLKRKIEMCKDCRAFKFCDGFFLNDINFFGKGKLKPIK